jgi:hypothetical protein
MQNSLKPIAGKLSALKDAANALSADATWKQRQTVSSSDPARVAPSPSSGRTQMTIRETLALGPG